MTKKHIAFSRRAVTCRRWTWGPGMLDLFGRRVRDVWPDDLGIKWSHLLDNRVVRDADALPDLSDPATLGCLLALVREAWGDPGMFARPRGGKVRPDWVMCAGQTSDIVCIAPTEAEALVAALEGAP